jgi:tetratricopeptide (TPR) repeat protein
VTTSRLVEAAKGAQLCSDFRGLERAARALATRCRREGEARVLGDAYAYLGAARIGHGDAPGARSAFERSRKWLERTRDSMGVVRALNGLAVTALDIDLDAVSARRHLEVALPIARRAVGKELHWLGIALGNLGEVQRLESDYRGAIASAREALAIVQEHRDDRRAAWQLINIAHCRFLLNDRRGALQSMEAAHGYLWTDDRDPRMVACYFDVWFIIAAGVSDWENAARLFGFADAFRAQNKLVRLPLLLPWIAPMVARLECTLPSDTRVALASEAGALSLSEANVLTEHLRTLHRAS